MPLLIVCAAALCGLLVGELASVDHVALGVAGIMSGLGSVLLWRRPGPRLLGLVCCAVALGALRAELHAPADPDPLAAFEHLPVVVHGQVATTPVRSERASRFVLAVERLEDTPLAVQTRILVIVDPDGPAGGLSLGDTVQAAGRLGPADGAAANAPRRTLLFPRLALVQTGSLEPLAVAARLRAAAIKSIQDYLPEPHASLAAGVLLGGSGRLSAEFRQQLQRSGLGHIVAIDGYKQVMVSGALGWAAVRLFGRPRAAGPILLGVLAYTVLTGVRPSAVRAGLMVGLATTAGVVGRLPDSLTSLMLAAVAMAGFDPDVLLDIGFQLSFSATLGLILLWPRLRRLVRGVPKVVAEPAGITLAVTLATLPVTLSVFQSVSLISPLAHVVGMPLLGPVLLGAALIALSAPLPPLASAVAWLAWWPTELLVATVRISGAAPAAALSTGQLPPLAAAALAIALLGWGLWQLPELAALRHRLWVARISAARTHQLVAPLAAAGLSVVGVALVLLVRPDGALHIDRLDVSPGEAVLIRGPTGRTVLVAQGRLDAFRLAAQVGQRLAVWEHGLHAAVSLDADAEPRLAATLDRYPAEQRLTADGERRVDLGGGAVLDLYVMPAPPAAAVSFGRVWVPLLGHPPRPLHAPDGSAPVLVEADAQQLVADGVQVWRPDQLRSGPTTSAARPAR